MLIEMSAIDFTTLIVPEGLLSHVDSDSMKMLY